MKKGNNNVNKFIGNYLKDNLNKLYSDNITFKIDYVNYQNGHVNYYVDYLMVKKLEEKSIEDTTISGRILLLKFDPEDKKTYNDLDGIIKELENKYENFLIKEEDEQIDKLQYVTDKKKNIVETLIPILESLEGTLSYFKSSHPYEMDLLLEDLYEDFNNIVESSENINHKINKMCEDLKN